MSAPLPLTTTSARSSPQLVRSAPLPNITRMGSPANVPVNSPANVPVNSPPYDLETYRMATSVAPLSSPASRSPRSPPASRSPRSPPASAAPLTSPRSPPASAAPLTSPRSPVRSPNASPRRLSPGPIARPWLYPSPANSPRNIPEARPNQIESIIALSFQRARENEANPQYPSTQEAVRLHQTKTYVGLFKANYKTNLDLALAAYEMVRQYLLTGLPYGPQDPKYYSPSNFLYRDQVIKIGLAEANVAWSAGLLYDDNGDQNPADFQYELWQLARNKPDFRADLLAYFDELGQDNYVYKALTADSPDTTVTPDNQAVSQLLNGQIPPDFFAQLDLIKMALALHWDWVWTRADAAQLSRFKGNGILNYLSDKAVKQLNLRLAQANDWTTTKSLLDFDLFRPYVWAGWILLTQGESAYLSLISQWAQTLRIKVLGFQVLAQIVDLVNSKGYKVTLPQWQGIVQAVLKGYQTLNQPGYNETRLMAAVGLATKVVLAMVYPQFKLSVGLSLYLNDDLLLTDDLTVIMANFVVTAEDLTTALTAKSENGQPVPHPSWAILLPWYRGDTAVLQQFINQSVAGTRSYVSPFIYLAAVAHNLTVPNNAYPVAPLRVENTPVLAYYIRKYWPKRLPKLVFDSNTLDDLTRSLLVNQSIVEAFYE